MTNLTIAVNTRLLLKNKLEGIGWFTLEVLKRICTQHPDVNFIFIFDRKPAPEFIFADNIKAVVVRPQARHPFLFYIWFNHTLPSLLKKIKPDLFLSPDGYHALPYKGKSLLVIHDINFEHYPADLPWLVRKYYRYYFPLFAGKATRIATVSAFSKNDIARQYGIPENKIDIVYDGVNESYSAVNEIIKEKTRARLTGGKEYFIFIGSLQPRKNLINLFNAFDIFKETDTKDIKLVITGAKKWWTAAIRDTFNQMKYNADVIFTGRLEVSELNQVLSTALALVYVSYFEGFGIPILEAFACKTPVITANCTSMPEIAGEAAIITDPFSAADIASAMRKIEASDTLREELVRKGTIRLTSFSWDKTADLLWQSMLATIREK